MEPTIPLHQIRHIIRSTSSKALRSAVFRNHPSLPDDHRRISLNLQKWANVLGEPIDTPSLARAYIDKILTFFINIASSNDLAMTPAVQSLQASLSVLRRGGDFSRDAAEKNWKERISQLSMAKTNHDPLSRLRNLCLHGFPIFNIWDSMSFIYTVCIEDVKTQIEVELYLYQFRMIICALRRCKEYFSCFAGPTTVAASWEEETQNQSIAVAFATTAVGSKEDNTKDIIAAARREFMMTITKALTTDSKKVNTKRALNRPGNCPEYMTWPVVCRVGGKYKSLCLNMRDAAYRCCGHCERTLEKLGANNIQIDDIWKTAFLSTDEGSDKCQYPYRFLKTQETILNEFARLRKV